MAAGKKKTTSARRTLGMKRGSVNATKDGEAVLNEIVESLEGPYEGPVAEVAYGVGATVNLGQFESARLDVRVTLPCLPGDVEKTYNLARTMATRYLAEERKKIKA